MKKIIIAILILSISINSYALTFGEFYQSNLPHDRYYVSDSVISEMSDGYSKLTDFGSPESYMDSFNIDPADMQQQSITFNDTVMIHINNNTNSVYFNDSFFSENVEVNLVDIPPNFTNISQFPVPVDMADSWAAYVGGGSGGDESENKYSNIIDNAAVENIGVCAVGFVALGCLIGAVVRMIRGI